MSNLFAIKRLAREWERRSRARREWVFQGGKFGGFRRGIKWLD